MSPSTAVTASMFSLAVTTKSIEKSDESNRSPNESGKLCEYDSGSSITRQKSFPHGDVTWEGLADLGNFHQSGGAIETLRESKDRVSQAKLCGHKLTSHKISQCQTNIRIARAEGGYGAFLWDNSHTSDRKSVV